MATSEKVLDVLTVKRYDNRPRLSMSVNEINQADQQPHADASWEKYRAEEFDQATRIELHMDYNDVDGKLANAGDHVRMVDGDVATWDSQSETVSIQLDRDDVPVSGEYLFEWVLIYDPADATTGEVPTSDNATEVNTVPVNGLFGLDVNEPSNRSLAEIDAPTRTVGSLIVGDLEGEEGGAVRLNSDIDAGTTQTVRRIRDATEPDDPTPLGQVQSEADTRIETHRASAIHDTDQPADASSLDGEALGQGTPLASLDADQTRIRDNRSVHGLLNHVYQGAAVADDGTHYALRYDGDLILDSGDSVRNMSELHRFTVGENGKRGLHITAQGTLLASTGSFIQRSTDGGATWTTVFQASSSVWTYDEASNGTLYATESGSNGTVALYQSTDDGATWTTLADGTTFSEFSRHVHRVVVHPVNDWIIVTGGDTGTSGWYRSTDGGTTWAYYNPLGVQWVGICPHPTDGSKYLLGADQPNHGPVAVVSDNGTSVSASRVLNPVLDANSSLAEGSFDITAIYDAAADEGAYLLAGAGDAVPLVWISDSLNGDSWRSLGQAPVGGTYSYVMNQTASQGPHRSTLDSDATTILGQAYIHGDTATDYHYGSDMERPADRRIAHSGMHYPSGATTRWREGSRDALEDMFAVPRSDGANLVVRYQFGQLRFRNGNTGNDIFRIDIGRERTDFQSNGFIGWRVLNNGGTTDLVVEELAIDENRGGTGATSLLFKDSTGAVHYWDADGML